MLLESLSYITMIEKCVTHHRKPVSYLRNRDFSKQFNWTQLNEDVYNCYNKAKSDTEIDHMNHVKLYWDELCPEFIHLAPKNLCDQADRLKNIKYGNRRKYQFTTKI